MSNYTFTGEGKVRALTPTKELAEEVFSSLPLAEQTAVRLRYGSVWEWFRKEKYDWGSYGTGSMAEYLGI